MEHHYCTRYISQYFRLAEYAKPYAKCADRIYDHGGGDQSYNLSYHPGIGKNKDGRYFKSDRCTGLDRTIHISPTFGADHRYRDIHWNIARIAPALDPAHNRFYNTLRRSLLYPNGRRKNFLVG